MSGCVAGAVCVMALNSLAKRTRRKLRYPRCGSLAREWHQSDPHAGCLFSVLPNQWEYRFSFAGNAQDGNLSGRRSQKVFRHFKGILCCNLWSESGPQPTTKYLICIDHLSFFDPVFSARNRDFLASRATLILQETTPRAIYTACAADISRAAFRGLLLWCSRAVNVAGINISARVVVLSSTHLLRRSRGAFAAPPSRWVDAEIDASTF